MASAADELASLSARELKRRLVEKGVDCSSAFEKSELLRLLTEAEAARPAPSGPATPRLPLRRHGTLSNFGGLRTTSDAKVYRGFDVTLASGERVPFVIDTAASNSIISPALAARLRSVSTSAVVSTTSATGAQTGLTQVRLGAVAIGSVPCGALDPIVMALPLAEEMVGLLGVDVLVRLDLDLRFREDVVVPYARGQFAAVADARGLRAVRCSLGARGLLFCQVQLGALGGGRTVAINAIVDTGSSTTIANWAAATAAGIATRESADYSAGYGVVGVSGDSIRTAESPALVAIGGAGAARRVALSIGDLPIFDALGFGASPVVILGLDALGSSRLVLSIGTGTLWLSEA
jgi:hypothetical protein